MTNSFPVTWLAQRSGRTRLRSPRLMGVVASCRKSIVIEWEIERSIPFIRSGSFEEHFEPTTREICNFIPQMTVNGWDQHWCIIQDWRNTSVSSLVWGYNNITLLLTILQKRLFARFGKVFLEAREKQMIHLFYRDYNWILHIFTEDNIRAVRGCERSSCGFPLVRREYGRKVGSEIMTDCREAWLVSFHAGSWAQQNHVWAVTGSRGHDGSPSSLGTTPLLSPDSRFMCVLIKPTTHGTETRRV